MYVRFKEDFGFFFYLADIGDFESFQDSIDRVFAERGGTRRDLDDRAEVIFEGHILLGECEHDGWDKW